jgi:serine/threonine protein kinase
MTGSKQDIGKLARELPDLVVEHSRFTSVSEPVVDIAHGGFAGIAALRDTMTSELCIGKRPHENKPNWPQTFDWEVRALARCRSLPYIVQIVGFTVVKPIMIVLKCYSGGNLDRRIIVPEPSGPASGDEEPYQGEEHPEEEETVEIQSPPPYVPLTNTEKISLLIKVAMSLKMFHGQNLVHLDFKSSNIFLDDKMDPFLGDFGTTRDLPNLPAKVLALTTIWAAPEVCTGAPLGQYTDIYAFGILVWVVHNGKFPFPDEHPLYTCDQTAARRRPPWGADAPAGLVQLADNCWAQDGRGRWTASQIVDYLCGNLELFGPCEVDKLASVIAEAHSTA